MIESGLVAELKMLGRELASFGFLLFNFFVRNSYLDLNNKITEAKF